MPHQCTECGRTFDDGSKQMLSGCPDCGGNKFQFQPSSARSKARKAAAESDASAASDAESANADAEPANADAESANADAESANADAESANADAESANADAADSSDTALPDERSRADVKREAPNPAQDANAAEVETDSQSAAEGSDQFDPGDDAEIENTTVDEDRAQRDARSSPTTSEEIDEARRNMTAAERERLTEADQDSSTTRGRGTPQGPPTDGPDEAAAEAFGLGGAVGSPDEQLSPNAGSQRDSEADAPEGPKTDLSELREELNDQFESIKITAPGQYELNLMELYDRKEYIISLQEDGRYVVDIPEGHEHRED